MMFALFFFKGSIICSLTWNNLKYCK